METLVSDNFIANYDDECTLSTGTVVSKHTLSQAGPFSGHVIDIKGDLDIYDMNTMSIKKHLIIEEKDLDDKWGGRKVVKKDKLSYFNFYGTAIGNLKYLIYDYIKELIYKINRDIRK